MASSEAGDKNVDDGDQENAHDDVAVNLLGTLVLRFALQVETTLENQ